MLTEIRIFARGVDLGRSMSILLLATTQVLKSRLTA
jgi:hypothetical protein